MRLTILNQFYAPDISPTAQLAASLAEHRARGGDDVTVVAAQMGYLDRPVEHEHAPIERLRVVRLPTAGLGRSSPLRRLLDYLVFSVCAAVRVALLPRQDVIVAMTTPPYLVLAALGHKLLHPRTRVVLWSMDCYPDAAERFGTMRPKGLVSGALRALNRWAFRRLDHLVCLDTAMVELLESQYAPPDGIPVTVIPNWERADLFPGSARPEPWPGYDAPELRDRFVVLYLGNAGMGHRFHTVLEAVRELQGDDVTFLFVGGGIRWGDLQAAQREGLDNLVLHEYVPKENTPGVLAGAGAALIALDDLALGVMSPSKLHSYLAMGLPVLYVGPEGSNVDDALVRYECGFSLRHGDVEGLVAAVHAIRDPGLHAQLAERARKAFEDAYCDARALPRFDLLLDALAP